MKRLIDQLDAGLAALEWDHARRRLVCATGIDLVSNDYLGLGRDPQHAARVLEKLQAMHAAGEALSAPAARLLGGTSPRHLALERRLATWKDAERALLFPSGYQANLALLTALLRPTDRVLSDARNHASLIDGMRLAGCRKEILPAGDPGALERALARPFSAGRTWLVVESLYSMDGAVAPLDRIAELAQRHGALLVVDDAHASGLFGARGSGLVEHFGVAGQTVAVVTTFGKALAAAGACVSASATVIDHLINRARGFIFTTAPSPLLLAAVAAALDVVEAEPARRRRALAGAERLRAGLRSAGLEVPAGPGPIVPIMVSGNARALAVAAQLQRAGFGVAAVRPPTVPENGARLRLSVHADHHPAMLDRLAQAVAGAVREAA